MNNNIKTYKMEFPQRIIDMVGKERKMRGYVFNHRTYTDTIIVTILKYRWGKGEILDTSKMTTHPTVEFLVKNDKMPKAKWTTGFPVEEITFDVI